MRRSAAETAALADAHARMAGIRAFEEMVADAHADGRLPGLLHLSIGGEAVAVGTTADLGPDDRIYTSHRGHGHFLAAGADPRSLVAELAGRETGLCRGRAGSMHLMSTRAVMATGVVGGSLPIAVGHALAIDEPGVVLAFFGDGAVQTGVFHETLNLASLWEARLLFVCENNGWAEFSAREEHTRVERVVDYAKLYKMKSAAVDGADVQAVRDATRRLLDGVRADTGPALLECHVSRLRPHYEGDLRREEHGANDPIERVERELERRGVGAAELQQVRAEARAHAQQCLDEALAEPPADPAHDAGLVFARPVP